MCQGKETYRYPFGNETLSLTDWENTLSTIWTAVQMLGDVVLVGGIALRLHMLLRGMTTLSPLGRDVDFCTTPANFSRIESEFSLPQGKLHRHYSQIEPDLDNASTFTLRGNNPARTMYLRDLATGVDVDVFLFRERHAVETIRVEFPSSDTPIKLLAVEELLRVRLISVSSQVERGYLKPDDIAYITILLQLVSSETMELLWTKVGYDLPWLEWVKQKLDIINNYLVSHELNNQVISHPTPRDSELD